jgi:uncharacterized protein
VNAPATDAAPPVRHVPCPACGSPSLFTAANRWRPFCSGRCARVDLGAWASEAYRVATSPPAGGDEGDGKAAPQ